MILKLEPGGTAPFVQYQPLVINTARASGEESSKRDSSSSSSKNDGKITQKDLLTMLKDIDGLPSDMEELYGNMINFMRMGEAYGREIDTSMLATQFIQSLRDIKTAVFRKDIFEKAYDQVEKNGGMHEVAITKDGKIIGRNKDGKLDAFSLEEFDSSEYTPVTNAELLRIRANDPNYAGQDYLSEIASNGIGLDQINKLIHEYVTSLGNTEHEGYERNPQQVAIATLKQFEEQLDNSELTDQEKRKLYQELFKSTKEQYAGTDENGLYKYISRSSANQIKNGLNYIYNMLPANARTLLELKSNGKGQQLILQLLNSKASDSIKWEMIENEDGVKPGTKESQDNQKIGVAIQWLKGYGSKQDFIFQDGSQDGMHLTASVMPITKNGDPIGITTASKIFESDYSGLLPPENISIAGQMIDPSNMNHIICQGRVYNVDMPIDQEAAAKGDIKPDLELSKKKKIADQIIAEKGYTSTEDKNRVYQQQQLPIKYDNDGKLITTNWRTFAAFNVTAYSGVFPDQDAVTFSDYVTELSGTAEDSTIAKLHQLNGKETDIDYDKKDGFWEQRGNLWSHINSHDSMYATTMWIPVDDSIINTLGPATKKQLNDANALDQQAARIRSIQENRNIR